MTQPWTIFDSLIGPLTLRAGAPGLTALQYPWPRRAARPGARATTMRWLVLWASSLEYFAGHRQAFAHLPLDLAGTDFQRSVWARLLEIPFGTTVSYLQLARALGRLERVRARRRRGRPHTGADRCPASPRRRQRRRALRATAAAWTASARCSRSSAARPPEAARCPLADSARSSRCCERSEHGRRSDRRIAYLARRESSSTPEERMTKNELVEQIAERAGLSKTQVGEALSATLDVIEDGLGPRRGDQHLWFGYFSAPIRDARQGVNPSTGEPMQIAATEVAAVLRRREAQAGRQDLTRGLIRAAPPPDPLRPPAPRRARLRPLAPAVPARQKRHEHPRRREHGAREEAGGGRGAAGRRVSPNSAAAAPIWFRAAHAALVPGSSDGRPRRANSAGSMNAVTSAMRSPRSVRTSTTWPEKTPRASSQP